MANADASASAVLPQGDDWDEGNEEDITEIPNCYCPNCEGGNAITIMLPTKIPLFREVIIMTLNCEECSFRNSEINFGGEIQPKGSRISLTLTAPSDLNRQLIKSDSATLLIPHLEFEIPPVTQRGSVSTIEGVLRRAADILEGGQGERLRVGDVDNFHRCRNVIQKLRMAVGDDVVGSDDDDDDDQKGEGVNKSSSFAPFEIILDDPAGNSYIENPNAPNADPNMHRTEYYRTPMQDMALGLQPSEDAVRDGTINDENPSHKNVVNVPRGIHDISIDSEKVGKKLVAAMATATPKGDGTQSTTAETLSSKTTPKNSGNGGNKYGDNDTSNEDPSVSIGKQEVLKFPTDCPHCRARTETDMCVTEIPHFKEVIIMSMLCDACGYRSNEIKGGGAIPKFGTKVTIRIETPDDLAREVLKSDTAGIVVPELDLELDEGGLDGFYTTVEGLLDKMRDRLAKANPFGSGDSATKQHATNDGGDDGFSPPSEAHVRYVDFLRKMKDMAEGRMLPFTLVISDPLSNSFVGPVPADAAALALQAERDGNQACYETYVDERVTVEEYERTEEQNEALGLNDIKTENYHPVAEDGAEEYYGTDQTEELPDRLRRLHHRGPDHPLEVAKGTVESDTTVMGTKSASYAVPGMVQRGTRHSAAAAAATAAASFEVASPSSSSSGSRMDMSKEEAAVAAVVARFEREDGSFEAKDSFDGRREGMIYKRGERGLGYYKDVPLSEVL